MGVLVKYSIAELDAADLETLGAGLDLLPLGRAGKLWVKMQMQISAQDAAAQKETAAAQSAAIEKWRSDERMRLRSEVPVTITPRKKRR